MSTTPTTTKYLVVVYVVTSGLDEGDLGSDEEEIVLLTWLVIDVTNCKVVAVHCKYVKPRSADVNVNVLSDVARTKFGLTEDLIKSGQPLEQVVEEFDQYAKSKLQCDGGRSFRLITDGQLHLRQVIHPEACKKGITLPDYFHSFHDLKKEFRKFYRNNDFQTIDEMLNCNLSFFFQCINSHPCLLNLPETSVYFIFKQLQPITCIQFNSNSSLNIAGFTKYQRYCKDLEKLISFS